MKEQIEGLSLLVCMLALFLSERLRYDLVAALTLAAVIIFGVVPADRAFTGFANPALIIIASALVLSRAVAVSGIIENLIRGLFRRLSGPSMQCRRIEPYCGVAFCLDQKCWRSELADAYHDESREAGETPRPRIT
jgi:Citrate transporter